MIRGLIDKCQNIRGQIGNNHFWRKRRRCVATIHHLLHGLMQQKGNCLKPVAIVYHVSYTMHLQICLTPTIIVWGEREDIQRKDHKKGGTSALDGGETGEKNEKTRGGENEQGVFFRKLRKITENRENTNRGEKKPKNWGCKQGTDENKRKGINREKDQNRRTQLEGTNNTGETWKREQRRMNRSKPGNKEQRKQKKSKKRGE